ncbi:aminotransferase class V-fold PLP-dependent enzyme [Clostridium botulinum]|nr:aminotransferase class V-fold PLP-dependent enzyme [Clostridium botulinum]
MIYLDNSATTFPKPDTVYNETIKCMKEYCANPGRSSHNMALESSLKVNECREEIANLFNIDKLDNIIFTSNATEALNLGIKGVLKKNDHVITSSIEHNSVLRPINKLKVKGIENTIIKVNKQGIIDINELKESIKDNTKLIVINHVSNVIGTIQDIELIGKIAREKDILFMVDASQSAGIIDIDVIRDNIDILAMPGHKSLLGPQGTGVLYIKDSDIIESIKEGGTGSNSKSLYQPEYMPDKLESGTLNVPGIVGLCEGIKFIKNVGIDNIKYKEQNLCNYLIEELKGIDNVKIYGHKNLVNKTAVVSFTLDNMDSSEVGSILNENNICVRTGYHCAALIHKIIGTENTGTVRVSPGYFNKHEDIEKLINVIRKISKN